MNWQSVAILIVMFVWPTAVAFGVFKYRSRAAVLQTAARERKLNEYLDSLRKMEP